MSRKKNPTTTRDILRRVRAEIKSAIKKGFAFSQVHYYRPMNDSAVLGLDGKPTKTPGDVYTVSFTFIRKPNAKGSK